MGIAGACAAADAQGIAVVDRTRNGFGGIRGGSRSRVAGIRSRGFGTAGIGQLNIRHLTLSDFRHLKVEEGHPAFFRQAPGVGPHLFLQGDLHLLAAAQGAYDGIAGARAAADIQLVGIDDGADGSDLGGILRIFRCHRIIVGIIQADPAGAEFAPLIKSAFLDLGDRNLLAVVSGAQLGIVGAGAAADIHTVAGDGNVHRNRIGRGIQLRR